MACRLAARMTVARCTAVPYQNAGRQSDIAVRQQFAPVVVRLWMSTAASI